MGLSPWAVGTSEWLRFSCERGMRETIQGNSIFSAFCESAQRSAGPCGPTVWLVGNLATWRKRFDVMPCDGRSRSRWSKWCSFDPRRPCSWRSSFGRSSRPAGPGQLRAAVSHKSRPPTLVEQFKWSRVAIASRGSGGANEKWVGGEVGG